MPRLAETVYWSSETLPFSCLEWELPFDYTPRTPLGDWLRDGSLANHYVTPGTGCRLMRVLP